jgi:site-specific DNA-cytosine methylase
MSWLYSQVLVEEYLAANSLDGEQSVQLSGKPTQQAYCAPDKMTDFSRLSRFGMMFKPLTANLGEELLMSYLADFHVPTLAAGKGAGIDGERSGMWSEMARIIREVRPRFVFVENSPMLTSRGLGRVLGDLASMGFDARWGVLGAKDVGANHQRDRIWIVGTNLAYAKELLGNVVNDNSRISVERKSIPKFGDSSWQKNLAYPSINGSQRLWKNREITRSVGLCDREGRNQESDLWQTSSYWQTEPNVGRVADGVAARVDRLKVIGNGQVPLCAATAWRILTER